VSATQRAATADDSCRTATLADLLYADEAKTRVSEEDWIQLVQAVATGDQAALHGLYERTHRMVFTFIVRIIKDRDTAEELTLDVFHDLWRRASKYDPAGGSVVGWIMNQARSRAIDRLRFEQRKKRVDPHPGGVPATPTLDSEAVIDGRARGERLRKALSTLTLDERQAIEAAFFSDLTHAEVATRLKQPMGTVKTRIRSGLEKLRQTLAASAEPL
jgi:RNA polymerase sigma-70 factor, ECF subfamily